MRKTAFMVFIALAVLAAAACRENPTGPSANSRALTGTESTGLDRLDATTTITKDEGFVGTWQATKAEGRNSWEPNIRRDIVAEGGTVTLVLEASKTYAVTLTMPGDTPRLNSGIWHYHEFWGSPQIDFYQSSIPDPEYGEIPSFYVSLGGNTLSLSEGPGGFLFFDFGWHDSWGNDGAILDLVLTRE
jgi:hypothetical protein